MFFGKTKLENLMTEKNKKLLVMAIKEAEKNTSGEIRVHMESFTNGKNVLDRAVEVFHMLEMEKTELRNGVLIYVALEDKKFAIIGDKGINEKVGEYFWEKEKEELLKYFKEDKILEGVEYFINIIGTKLKEYFPYQDDDVNELSDDISIGQ